MTRIGNRNAAKPFNTHTVNVSEHTVSIEIKPDVFAIIDVDDLDLVKSYRWSLQKSKVAYTHAYSNGRWVLMHRLIMSAKNGETVDHVNGCGLDNRRSNLRMASSTENGRNRRKQPGTSSKWKGVTKPKRGKWIAGISYGGKRYHLGSFSEEADAAQAYNFAAAIHFGPFAVFNEAEQIDESFFKHQG